MRKNRTPLRLVLQPASRRATRRTSLATLRRFFAIADAWELSPLQQCRLLKIPSPQVLERYRLGQAPRLSAAQQERAALVANIQHALTADEEAHAAPTPDARSHRPPARPADASKERAWAFLHAPRADAPFAGDSPLYYMLENGLPALREVARLLVRERPPR